MEGKEPFEFVNQTVKERPLNRKKLIRKTLITVAMALIFGLIASVTFLVLQPVITNWLYPEEEIEQIKIPATEEEILPEEMVEHEQEILEPSQEIIDSLRDEFQVGIEDYNKIYKEMYQLVKAANSSMVTVTGMSGQSDWLPAGEEEGNSTVGFIFAENNAEILIFTESKTVEKEEKIMITLPEKEAVEGYLKEKDVNTGLAVVAVEKAKLTEAQQEQLTIISLGSSDKKELAGTPVIALGRPMGENSVMYGMITGKEEMIHMADDNYRYVTTDMYGNSDAFGVLIDISGKVIGVIDQRHNKTEVKNRISALGITELKSVLQHMGNGLPDCYMGLKISDVPKEVIYEKNIPKGIYITSVILGSPAMEAGIQRGDILTKIEDNEIGSVDDYRKYMVTCSPAQVKELTLMRQGPSGYVTVQISLTVAEQK